jgi:hypothetical protein
VAINHKRDERNSKKYAGSRDFNPAWDLSLKILRKRRSTRKERKGKFFSRVSYSSTWRLRLLALSQQSSPISQTSELPNKDTGVHSRSPSPSAFNSVLILRHRSSSKKVAQYYTPTSPLPPPTISPSLHLHESRSTIPILANS